MGPQRIMCQCSAWGVKSYILKAPRQKYRDLFDEKHIACKTSKDRCLFWNEGDVSTTMHLTAIARHSSVRVIVIKSIHTCLSVCYCIAIVYRIKNFRIFIDFLICVLCPASLFHRQTFASHLHIESRLAEFLWATSNFQRQNETKQRKLVYRLVVRKL